MEKSTNIEPKDQLKIMAQVLKLVSVSSSNLICSLIGV